MNASDAPTRRMISISSARATTASRIVFTMMNSTITPTIATIATPAVRTTPVTVTTRSTRASMLSTLRTIGSSRRAPTTTSRSPGAVSLTLTLAYRGLESRYWVRSSRPCASWAARNRASASSRVMNSTDTVSGMASTRAMRSSTWACVAVFSTYATTSTFCSTNDRLASSTFWSRKKPARSSSIRTIVSVAARLIRALRQKPCQARPSENSTKAITRQSSR